MEDIMNIFKSLLLSCAAIAAGTICLHAATVVYTIGDGGSLAWNGGTGDFCRCDNGGSGCKMTITTNAMVIRDNGNTWHVEGTALAGAYVITEPQQPDQPFVVTNYTYGSGYFVVNTNEFQGVPAGTRINLAGVQTDDKGNFIADVPK